MGELSPSVSQSRVPHPNPEGQFPVQNWISTIHSMQHVAMLCQNGTKNCHQKETALVMATKSPKHQPPFCLRRSSVPDLWLLKCQRYLHHCAGGEEGFRRANSLLRCNSGLTLYVGLGSSKSLCASHHL